MAEESDLIIWEEESNDDDDDALAPEASDEADADDVCDAPPFD